jgi:hypothetical protein
MTGANQQTLSTTDWMEVSGAIGAKSNLVLQHNKGQRKRT